LLVELMKSIAEASRVLLRDREDTVAALGAARTAGKVRAATLDGGDQGCIDDLNEVVNAALVSRHS
jgi:hypothetical protein